MHYPCQEYSRNFFTGLGLCCSSNRVFAVVIANMAYPLVAIVWAVALVNKVNLNSLKEAQKNNWGDRARVFLSRCPGTGAAVA